MSSTLASLPLPIRICIEVLSPECRELVKRVADRLGQRVENEVMTGFASYVLARVTAAAEHDDDDECLEEDEDKENQPPEEYQEQPDEMEGVTGGEEHRGDVHTAADLEEIAAHFASTTTNRGEARLRDHPDANKENVQLPRPEEQHRGEALQIGTTGIIYPSTGVYNFWAPELINSGQILDFPPYEM